MASFAPAVGATLDTIRVGNSGTDATSEALYGTNAGLFARVGLTVDNQRMAGGGATADAIIGNSLDAGFVSIVTVAGARLRGVPLVAIAPGVILTTKRPTTVMCKLLGSPLKTGADLNGKTIAVSTLNSELPVAALAWVEKNGGSYETVKFLEMPFPLMAPSLAQHRVDAAMIAEPFVSTAQGIELLADAFAAIAPGVMVGVFAATAAYVDQHRDIVRRFAKGMAATARWANTHYAESAQMLVDFAQVEPATVARMNRQTYAEALDPVYIAPLLDAAFKYGIIKSPVKASDINASL